MALNWAGLPEVRRRASGRRPHHRHLRSESGRTVGGGSARRREAGRGARRADHAAREAGDRRRQGEEHGRPRPARRLVRHRARRVPRRHARRSSRARSRDVLEANERAFAAGMEYADGAPARRPRASLPPPESNGATKLVADGNEMCAAAAIFAGCEFFGGYPITPSSEIMQFLDREIWKYGGTVLQAEDEIAGIGAVVGASFAGKKAMTATSGPGMSLKTEMLGLASIAELPLVCVNVQRGGPSTGMPTKSEQADLFQADLLRARRRRSGRCSRRPSVARHVRDHRRSVQHRRAVPDAGDPAVRSGDRAAQGDRRPDRCLRDPGRRAPARGGQRARALRPLPAHRVRRQPDQRSRACPAATTSRPGSSTTSTARRRRAAPCTRA